MHRRGSGGHCAPFPGVRLHRGVVPIFPRAISLPAGIHSAHSNAHCLTHAFFKRRLARMGRDISKSAGMNRLRGSNER